MPFGKELPRVGNAISKAKDLNEEERYKDECTLMEKDDVTLLKQQTFVRTIFLANVSYQISFSNKNKITIN